MKKFIFILLSLLLSFAGYAKTNGLSPVTEVNQKQFQQVQDMLSKADHLSGNFEQTQKIKLLSTPLVSNGHFALSKNKGLEWYQEKPFHSRLIVTATQIEQQLEHSPPTIITKEQQPIVFSFSNLFLSVFNGDTKNITSYFNIYFAGNIDQWTISLEPSATPLNKAITSIEMSGAKYINSITINQAQNNQMIIKFSNVKES